MKYTRRARTVSTKSRHIYARRATNEPNTFTMSINFVYSNNKYIAGCATHILTTFSTHWRERAHARIHNTYKLIAANLSFKIMFQFFSFFRSLSSSSSVALQFATLRKATMCLERVPTHSARGVTLLIFATAFAAERSTEEQKKR